MSAYPTLFTTDAPYDVGSFAYDCVIAFAIAMARSVDPTDGDEVSRAFRQVSFGGASGLVEFDPNTADRTGSSATYVLMNWRANGSKLDAMQVNSISIMSGLSNTSNAVRWIGGGTRLAQPQLVYPALSTDGLACRCFSDSSSSGVVRASPQLRRRWSDDFSVQRPTAPAASGAGASS